MKGSYFDGNFLGYIGIHLLAGLIFIISLGVAAPWSVCMVKQWELEHTIINNRRLKFTGEGVEAVGTWILLLIVSYGAFMAAAYLVLRLDSRPNLQRIASALVLLAVLLYVPFVRILILKWLTKHTIFDSQGPRTSGLVSELEYTPQTVTHAPPVASSTVPEQTASQASLIRFVFGVILGVGGCIAMFFNWFGLIALAAGILVLLIECSK